MELYTDKLFVGRIGKVERDEKHSKRIVPTSEYIIFEKNNSSAIDVLTNNRYFLKENKFIGIDNDKLCIIDSKPIVAFLPDKSLEVVNDYDILEIFNRVNNNDIYENAEQEDFSNIVVFKNAESSQDDNIIRL